MSTFTDLKAAVDKVTAAIAAHVAPPAPAGLDATDQATLDASVQQLEDAAAALTPAAAAPAEAEAVPPATAPSEAAQG